MAMQCYLASVCAANLLRRRLQQRQAHHRMKIDSRSTNQEMGQLKQIDKYNCYEKGMTKQPQNDAKNEEKRKNNKTTAQRVDFHDK